MKRRLMRIALPDQNGRLSNWPTCTGEMIVFRREDAEGADMMPDSRNACLNRGEEG